MPSGQEQRVTAYSCAFIALVMVAVTLSYTSALLIPFVFSIILYYILQPLVTFLQSKLRFQKGFAVTIILFITLLVFGGVITVVSSMLRDFIQEIDVYKSKFFALVENYAPLLESYGLSLKKEDIRSQLSSLQLFSVIKTIGAQLANIFSKSTIVFLFLMFIMSGPNESREEGDMWSEIHRKIHLYVMTKFWISLATGLLVGVFFGIVQLKFAFMFAVLTFMLNFIPTIGSLIATLLPIPIVLIEFQSPGMVLAAILVPGAIQFTIGNIIEPRVMGRSFNIHPVVIILSLIFWGIIWGIPGAFLAVPLMVSLKIVLGNFQVSQGLVPLFEGVLPRGRLPAKKEA